MTTTAPQVTYLRHRPAVGDWKSAPIRATVAEVRAALGSNIAAIPNAEDVIETYRLTCAALDELDRKCAATGHLSPADQHNRRVHEARLLPALRQLGLYHAPSFTGDAA